MSECDNLEKRVKMLIVDGWRYQTVRDKNGIAVGYGWDNGQSSLTDKELKTMTDTEFLDSLENDEPANNDAINHPAYYTDGKIEVSDFIADKNLNNKWQEIENRIQLSKENIAESNITEAAANAKKAIELWKQEALNTNLS